MNRFKQPVHKGISTQAERKMLSLNGRTKSSVWRKHSAVFFLPLVINL